MFEDLTISKELMPSDPRFGVGPSKVPVEFIEALLSTGKDLLGTSHRKPAVRGLVAEVQNGLKQFFNLPAGYEIILGNGGATFLFDMIGLGLVKQSSYHYVCGEFSSKWYLAHKNIPWIKAEVKEVAFGGGLDIEDQTGFDMICCTLNETSTGVKINQLPEVGEETILAVDATSGAGQIPMDMSKVDLYFFSPQKVFGSEGGFYIAIMSPKAIKRAEELEKSSHYRPITMSWGHAISNSVKNQTYNTPSITTIFYLNEQIKLMNKLGEEKVYQLSLEKMKLLETWVDEKDYLDFYIQDVSMRSNTVATINVDEKYSVTDLGARLRELKVAYDIEAYRKLGKNQLRISLFHNVSKNDLEKLTKIISYAIESV